MHGRDSPRRPAPSAASALIGKARWGRALVRGGWKLLALVVVVAVLGVLSQVL